MKRISAFVLAILLLSISVGCRKNSKDDFSSGEILNSGIIKVDVTDDNTDDKSTESEDKNTDNNSESTPSEKDNSTNKNNNSNNSDKQNGSSATLSNTTNNNSENKNSSNNSTSNPSSSGTDKTDTEYKKIECRAIESTQWKRNEFVVKENNFYFRLNMPSDWEFLNGEIIRNGIPIGKISTKAPNGSVESFEEIQRGQTNDNEISIKSSIEKFSNNGKNSYQRLYKISRLKITGGYNIYISVDYAQLDNIASSKIYNDITYLGTYRSMPDKENLNSSKKILILADDKFSEKNSKITAFLNDMFSANLKDGYSAEIITKNNAKVSDFANDNDLLTKIESGEYLYVFQGGFIDTASSLGNSESDSPMKKITDACNKSKTGLVIFPTYSETSSVIRNTLEKYTNLYCINLKEEIENLRNSGVSENAPTSLTIKDFINDDGSNTPLSGYVGAHMIYRNIFKALPNNLSENAPLGMSAITEKLKTYPSTAIIPGQDEITKYYI